MNRDLMPGSYLSARSFLRSLFKNQSAFGLSRTDFFELAFELCGSSLCYVDSDTSELTYTVNFHDVISKQ